MRTIVIASFVGALGLAGCIPDVMNTKPEVKGLAGAAPVQTLLEPENNTDITLRPGGQLVLRLESNPTTGYYWVHTGGEAAIAAQISDDYIADPAPEGVVGSGGMQEITYSGVAKGKTTIALSYQRGPEDVFEVRNIKVKVIE